MKQNKERLQNVRSNLSKEKIRLNDLNQENGASTWLVTLPLEIATILGSNPCALWLEIVQSSYVL